MRILSFDTSTSNLYACLTEGKNIIAEQILICNREDRQYAASLIVPTIDELLKKAHWKKSDLQFIVVGTGPGSFTGIRIAVVTARTLAQALNLPLIGINVFECYAFAEQIKSFPAAMVLEAGKGQYYCAHLNGQDMETHHLTVESLCSHLNEYEQVYIPASLTEMDILSTEKLKTCRYLADLSSGFNYAVNQARMADYIISQLSESAGQDEPHINILTKFPYETVKPLYIRNASVTMKGSG